MTENGRTNDIFRQAINSFQSGSCLMQWNWTGKERWQRPKSFRTHNTIRPLECEVSKIDWERLLYYDLSVNIKLKLEKDKTPAVFPRIISLHIRYDESLVFESHSTHFTDLSFQREKRKELKCTSANRQLWKARWVAGDFLLSLARIACCSWYHTVY